MKKKIIIPVIIVAFLLVIAIIVNWYITSSESFYPEHIKIGKFIGVNSSEKCYIYDEATGEFTGDYFTIDLKTKGFDDKGGMKIGENGHGSLVHNGAELTFDTMYFMFESYDEYGQIEFVGSDVEFNADGRFNKASITYSFIYSNDFSKLKNVYIYEDGKDPIIGYVAEDLEAAKALIK